MIKRKKVRRRAYPIPPVGQLGLSVDETCAVTGLGRSKISEAIHAGLLPARRLGKKIIIMRPDAEAFVRDLPAAAEVQR